MPLRRHQDPWPHPEDTRLVTPRKLALLLGLVALALAWATRTAAILLGRKAPPRKTHGYLAQSWFRSASISSDDCFVMTPTPP